MYPSTALRLRELMEDVVREGTGTNAAIPGAVVGGPRLLLRLEGLAVLALSIVLYRQTGAGWTLFALLFLAPDLSMLGYLAGPGPGARTYNAVHSYLVPLLLAVVGVVAGRPLVPVALVWTAHIGFDRVLGYGLKYPTAFSDTHLGRIGRAR